jgi:DNA-binding LacI/PurR family transcriptional regulator
VAIHADPATAVDDHYFGGLYWPLQTEFARRQVTVDLVRIGPSMVAEGSQGLVAINPSEHELDDLLEYARGGAPVVVLGASWSDYGFSQVDSDNLLGAMLAMNHLIDLGHQKILVVGACPQDSNTRDRMEGAMRAIKGRQLPHRDEHFLMLPDVNELRAEHRARLRKLLRASDSPSAIFAGGAQTAMQLFAFCRELGLEVPGQISLVGYDDPSFLSMAYPPITTVRQPLAEMALNACELLLDRAITRDPRSERRLLDPELVVRGTTAPYSPTDA